MSNVNHSGFDTLMQFFQLAAKFPLQMWVNNGEWFVKHNYVNIVPNEPAAH